MVGAEDRATGVARWVPGTMTLVHSTTTGMAAMVMALARSRGWLDYDEPVGTYWPEFAQAGKERITLRQLLAHQEAGCSPSTRRPTSRWSPTSTASPASWPDRVPPGRRGSGSPSPCGS